MCNAYRMEYAVLGAYLRLCGGLQATIIALNTFHCYPTAAILYPTRLKKARTHRGHGLRRVFPQFPSCGKTGPRDYKFELVWSIAFT
jgi:hypothetical protein